MGVAKKVIYYLYALGKQAIWVMVALVLFNLFIVTIFIVDGISMVKVLDDGDVVLVERLKYSLARPQRGDVVVVRYPGDPEKRNFVKRIIGLPGEQIVVKGGVVTINGQRLVESYLSLTLETDRDRQAVLKDNEYYVLGDNRPISNDSRVFGPVEQRFFVGRVVAIAFPISQAKIVSKIFY